MDINLWKLTENAKNKNEWKIRSFTAHFANLMFALTHALFKLANVPAFFIEMSFSQVGALKVTSHIATLTGVGDTQ